MKTMQSFLVFLLLASAITAPGQTQKKSTPPPPPPTVTVKKFPPPKVNLEKFQPPVTLSEFLKKNPTVSNVGWKNKNQIIVHLKTGTEETYNLNNEGERKLFRGKYGAPPSPPPPPPTLKKVAK